MPTLTQEDLSRKSPYYSGGTDVAVADGGTGASTAANAATNLGLGTGDSPQFAGINLGHASDTTITRTGAGDVAIEGNGIYRAGGTDVLVADGGTGASTAAGAATNLGLGTGDSPQFAGVNIGHASDTTITRTGAGDLAVEGNGIYRAGGTDVAVADGGTGSSTASAARTALGFSTAAVQPIMNNSFHAAGNASITMTTQPAAAAFPGGTAGNRMIRKVDLTNYSQARMLVNMNTTAGAAGATINLRYKTSYDLTPGNYLTMGASSTEIAASLAVASVIADSGWVNLDPSAKADVYIAPIGLNGDASASPVVSSIVCQFR